MRKRIRTATVAAAVLAAAARAAAGCGTENTPVAENVAVEAAEQWLNLVDRDTLELAWANAAPELKGRRPEQQWVADVRSARAVLGELVDREPEAKRYEDDPSGYGTGVFVIATFHTDFTEKQGVEELVVMRLVDGRWRPVRYLIEPGPS